MAILWENRVQGDHNFYFSILSNQNFGNWYSVKTFGPWNWLKGPNAPSSLCREQSVAVWCLIYYCLLLHILISNNFVIQQGKSEPASSEQKQQQQTPQIPRQVISNEDDPLPPGLASLKGHPVAHTSSSPMATDKSGESTAPVSSSGEPSGCEPVAKTSTANKPQIAESDQFLSLFNTLSVSLDLEYMAYLFWKEMNNFFNLTPYTANNSFYIV